MIFYLLLLTVVAFIFLGFKYTDGWWTAAVVVGVVGAFFGLFIPSVVMSANQTEKEVVYSLSELKDGAYVIGTGTPSDREYSFLATGKDGSTLSDSVNSSWVTIQELRNETKGALVVSKRSFLSWVVLPFATARPDEYKFIVPEGTVLETYSID